MPHVREGDEGQVDGVEHELDRHEDGDDVALDEEGGDADRKEDGGEDEVARQMGTMMRSWQLAICSFRARTTAPRIATRIRTLVTSKGSRSLVKSTCEISEMLLRRAGEVAADLCACRGRCAREKDEAEQAEDGGGAGDAGDVGGSAAVGALFFARVQQHDDEDEQHHDGAGVDDDLGGGEELRAERPVEDRERHHHHDQRQRAVDGMALEEQIERSGDGQHSEDDEEGKLHGVRLVLLNALASVEFWLCADCKAASAASRF